MVSNHQANAKLLTRPARGRAAGSEPCLLLIPANACWNMAPHLEVIRISTEETDWFALFVGDFPARIAD